MVTHPARLMPYDVLMDGLSKARDARLIYERKGEDGLLLYVYAERCVYERAWDEFTILARGLVVDPVARRVVATPFPKFHNVGEYAQAIPDLSFDAWEKMDGSLIITFHHGGRWRSATKGSFSSAQALWAGGRMDRHGLSSLVPGATYLFEATYPENRIVVPYAEGAMVLLGAYEEHGREMEAVDLEGVARSLGWPLAARHSYDSIPALMADVKAFPRTREGVVLRFSNGLRLKVKGDAYLRVHAMIARVTPLALWEALAAGDDIEAIRRELPEEFWSDFDAILSALSQRMTALDAEVSEVGQNLAHLSDKEVGLCLPSLPPHVRPFVFPWRKGGGTLLEGRGRAALLRAIRPDGNVLAGYVPSYAVARAMDDE